MICRGVLLLEMDNLNYDGKEFIGLCFDLGNIPLVLIKAKNGYVACSYISKETAEKVGDIACFVTGVKDYNSLYKAKIKTMTSWAEDLGIREGMSVKKALEIMNENIE